MKRTIVVTTTILLVITLGIANGSEQLDGKYANVAELGWLVGHWQGDGFGGTSEEIWSPPRDGVMMGMFRHYNKDGSLNFYEFLVISEDGLRLKHFNPDMTGWEEKDDFLHFRFKSQTAERVEFGGLTFQKEDNNRMNILLRMKTSDGERTEVFAMQRVKP